MLTMCQMLLKARREVPASTPNSQIMPHRVSLVATRAQLRVLTTTQFSECTMWTGPLAFLCTEEWTMRPVTPSTRKMPMKVRSWCTSVLSVTTASRLGFRLWGGEKSSSEPQWHVMAPRHGEPWREANLEFTGLAEESGFLVERASWLDCHRCTRLVSAECHAMCFAYLVSLNP